jgi:hypothetical protein
MQILDQTADTGRAAVLETMQLYIDGCRAGKGDLMRPGFHPDATIVGYYPGGLLTGPVQQLFGWIDGNGPAPDIRPRYGRIEIFETIAGVHLDVENWSGTLVPRGVRMSDIFTLLKTREDGWKITHKTFHWYSQ